MFDLSGKKALITGASGNIGSAIAIQLHEQGAEIIVSGRCMGSLKKLAFILGSKCHILSCDLMNRNEVSSLIKRTENSIGKLDILINNAGITKDNLIVRMKDEDWDNVLEVNLTSIFLLTREAVKSMIRNRYGRIINISSVVGITGNPGQVNYCSSKGGIISFSKSLAQEIASRGITVNCIAPGFIKSSMSDKLNQKQKKIICNKIPIGKIGLPQDISSFCGYLASKESQYITGQTIHINGGMVMI